MCPEDINARGHAGSWKAQLLAEQAQRHGESMAKAWRRDVATSVAFNVPATCTKVTTHFVEYRFADGSTDTYARNP